jgi:hypothetical protein
MPSARSASRPVPSGRTTYSARPEEAGQFVAWSPDNRYLLDLA